MPDLYRLLNCKPIGLASVSRANGGGRRAAMEESPARRGLHGRILRVLESDQALYTSLSSPPLPLCHCADPLLFCAAWSAAVRAAPQQGSRGERRRPQSRAWRGCRAWLLGLAR